jgi:hypothetical protein
MLYVDFEKPRTIKEFLEIFFGNNTFGEYSYKSAKTYSDSEFKSVQCYENKRRSFDDIYELVNTYYSNVSKKKLLHILIMLDLYSHTNQKAKFNFHYCCDIHKSVMYYEVYGVWRDFTKRKGHSKYSWKELMAMMNIHNQQQFKSYQQKHLKK